MEAAAIILNTYVLATAFLTVAVLAHSRGRNWFTWLCLCVAITPLWAMVLVLGLPKREQAEQGQEAPSGKAASKSEGMSDFDLFLIGGGVLVLILLALFLWDV